MSAGATEKIYYDARSTKDTLCDLSEYVITVKSSNENVATATKDSITAVNGGKTWITYSAYKKDASYYDEYTFCVVVE